MAINNFFSVDVEVDQTQNNLKAQVLLQSRDVIGVRYVYTSDIIEELSKQGWSVGDCLSVGRLDNVTNRSLASEWVFSLGPSRPIEEPVVLKKQPEEKKAAPRRRRTKTKSGS